MSGSLLHNTGGSPSAARILRVWWIACLMTCFRILRRNLMPKVAKLGGYKILGCCTRSVVSRLWLREGETECDFLSVCALLLVHRSINWGSWLCTGLSRQMDQPDRAGLKESLRTRPCLGSCRGSSLGFETSLDFRCSQCSGTACHLVAQQCTVQTFQLSQKISKNTQVS